MAKSSYIPHLLKKGFIFLLLTYNALLLRHNFFKGKIWNHKLGFLYTRVTKHIVCGHINKYILDSASVQNEKFIVSI